MEWFNPERGIMRARILISLTVLMLLFVLGCENAHLAKIGLADDPADLAKKRVDFILTAAKDRDPEKEQAAACQWYKGTVYVQDQNEQEAAVDGYDSWRREGDIYDGMDSYEIIGVRPSTKTEGTFYVDVTIDGEKKKLKVPKDDRISWAG
jgi:hypothetical protein